MSRYRKSMAETMAEVEKISQELPEVSPPGWEGSVKAMKKHKDIDNPWALAWHMKNKGNKPHYKDQDGRPEKKAKYKNEEVDTDGIVQLDEKDDKRTHYPSGRKEMRSRDRHGNLMPGWKSTIKDKKPKKEELETEANLSIPPKGSGKPVRKYGSSKGGNLSIPPKKEDMSLAPKGKGKKAAKALYKEEDIDMPSLVQQAINELTPDQKKKREASRTHSTLGKGRRLHGGRSAAHPKGAMVSGKTHTYDKPTGTPKKPGRQKIVATPVKKEGTEGDALVKAVANSPKQQALKKKQMLSITSAGKKAVKKGDHKLSITAKGRAAVKEGAKELEARNAAKADKKQQGGSLKHKVWPASASMKMPKEDMSLAPKGKGRKAAKALYKENEVTHFGDILRQAIEEAKKVDAIKEINKIVKTKTMGKLHGQKVDLFTASAIQQVYKAINHKNKEKMNSVMSKDIHGLLKMADFSMSKMKR